MLSIDSVDRFIFITFPFYVIYYAVEICVLLDQNVSHSTAPPGGGVNKAMRARMHARTQRAAEEQVCAFDLIKTVKS